MATENFATPCCVPRTLHCLTATQPQEMESYASATCLMNECRPNGATLAVRKRKRGYNLHPRHGRKPGDKIYYNNRASPSPCVIARNPSEGQHRAAIESPGWTSSPIPCMRTLKSPISRPITTAASKSTSGLPFLWRFTAWCTARTAPSSPSPSARTTVIPC